MSTNLQSLVWVRDEFGSTEECSVEYALDAVFVYRRTTNSSEKVPSIKYSRTSHRDVLRMSGNWVQLEEGLWEPVHSTGKLREAEA